MAYIGAEPIVSATRTITEITATAGQTVFVANGGYTVGYIDVFVNGAQLQTVDFTATNGSSITLTEAAQAGDVIRLVAWGTFQSANLNGAGILDGTVTQAKLATGVAGTAPAFSAYNSIATSVPNATWTKLQNSNEEFDTANCYDSTTNYRFTPNVAGYYQVNGAWAQNGGSGVSNVAIYKNGVAAKAGGQTLNSTSFVQNVVSALIYLNGTTDYVELYGYQASGGAVPAYTGNQPEYGYFQAAMVRAV